MPETKNYKYDPPRDVTIEKFDADVRYSLAEIVDVVGPLPEIQPATDESEPYIHNRSIDDRIIAARAWLAKREPAVEGVGGDNHTYETCCAVLIGFDLPIKQALPLLTEWNQKNDPPWQDDDLARKLRNAEKYGTGSREGPRQVSAVGRNAVVPILRRTIRGSEISVEGESWLGLHVCDETTKAGRLHQHPGSADCSNGRRGAVDH